MTIQNSQRPAMAAALMAAAVAMSAYASAEAANARSHLVASTAICEAPLPQYGLPLAKGPFAITNQGTAGVFLSCAMPTDTRGLNRRGIVTAVVRAGGSGGVVNCTMAAGHNRWGVYYQPTSITLPANGSGVVSWANVDKGDESGGTYAFSCVLPPGYSLEGVSWRDESNIGDL